MRAAPAVIEAWVKDRQAELVAVLEHWDIPVRADRVDAAVAEGLTKLNYILEHGLDIGTVVERVVPVALVKSEVHGWVFQRDSGEMFPVNEQLRQFRIRKRKDG